MTLTHRNWKRPTAALCLALGLSLGMGGCNMFMNIAAKTRSTVNTLGKRNVEFQRPAAAKRDLDDVETVVLGDLQGDPTQSARVTGYLATYLSDSGRFSLKQAPTNDNVPHDVQASPDADAMTGVARLEGSIVQSEYSERTDSKTVKCGDNKTCTTKTRTGTAVVTVNFSLVDAASGQVLVQKTLEDRKEQATSSRDGAPASIDGNAMLDAASSKVAGDFFAEISPHIVTETVFFETDNAAKSLKEGANRAMSGDLEGATAAFEAGLAEAEAKKDTKAIAKARFDLGLARVMAGEYEEGLKLLQQAQQPKMNRNWSALILAAKDWETDAQRAMAQWEKGDAQTPEIDPDLRPSEGATEDGAQTVRALRSVAGV